jgi:hypothetical protein
MVFTILDEGHRCLLNTNSSCEDNLLHLSKFSKQRENGDEGCMQTAKQFGLVD